MALTKIRPMFVNIPGVIAPAPFGSNIRTIVVKFNPELMQSYGLSAEEVTTAIAQNNFPSPAENIRIGDQNLMKLEIFGDFTTMDNIVKTGLEEFTEGSKASIK